MPYMCQCCLFWIKKLCVFLTFLRFKKISIKTFRPHCVYPVESESDTNCQQSRCFTINLLLEVQLQRPYTTL
jgi:hypothetical protein